MLNNDKTHACANSRSMQKSQISDPNFALSKPNNNLTFIWIKDVLLQEVIESNF